MRIKGKQLYKQEIEMLGSADLRGLSVTPKLVSAYSSSSSLSSFEGFSSSDTFE
jgi:hypothetical protein